jgi:hypothetical protein
LSNLIEILKNVIDKAGMTGQDTHFYGRANLRTQRGTLCTKEQKLHKSSTNDMSV